MAQATWDAPKFRKSPIARKMSASHADLRADFPHPAFRQTLRRDAVRPAGKSRAPKQATCQLREQEEFYA